MIELDQEPVVGSDCLAIGSKNPGNAVQIQVQTNLGAVSC